MTESENQKVADEVITFEPVSVDEIASLNKEELVSKLEAAYLYIERIKPASDEREGTKEVEVKLRQQLSEIARRENQLIKALTEGKRELSDMAAQIDELKLYQLPSNAQLRSFLLEPTVNIIFTQMKKELESTQKRLEDSQSELSAWQFTQDSHAGKQLMARCRTLLKENEELGKQISQGRIAKQEGEIALEKKLVEEMKEAQHETDQFVMELDEETEGMQATIQLLQQQLREAKDKLAMYTSDQLTDDAQQSPEPTELMESESVEPTEPALTQPLEDFTEEANRSNDHVTENGDATPIEDVTPPASPPASPALKCAESVTNGHHMEPMEAQEST